VKPEVGKVYDTLGGEIVTIVLDLRTLPLDSTQPRPYVGVVKRTGAVEVFNEEGRSHGFILTREHRDPEVVEGFAIVFNGTPSIAGCLKVSTNTYDTPENAWKHSGLIKERGKLFKVVMTEVI